MCRICRVEVRGEKGVVSGGLGWSGATDGTPRCEGRWLPRVGGGRGGVGADKWVWEGVLFPKVPAGMTRRRRWGVDWLCECASMRALACVKGRAMLRAEVLIK